MSASISRKARQFGDGDLIFARRAAQREKPLLDAFEVAWIEGRASSALSSACSASERASTACAMALAAGSSSVCACGTRRSSRRAHGDLAGGALSAENGERVANVARDLSARCMVWRRSASSSSSPARGAKLCQLFMRVAQIIGVAARLCDALFLLAQGAAGVLQRRPQRPHFGNARAEPAMGVDEGAMGGGVDERPSSCWQWISTSSRRWRAAPAPSPAGR